MKKNELIEKIEEKILEAGNLDKMCYKEGASKYSDFYFGLMIGLKDALKLIKELED